MASISSISLVMFAEYTNPSAEIQRVELLATVQRVELLTSIQHIELLMSSEMDASGRFRFIENAPVFAVDAKRLLNSKRLTDSQAITDDETVSLTKALNDAPTTQDEAARSVIKACVDEQYIADRPFLSLSNKPVASSFPLTDSRSALVYKNTADAQQFSDDERFEVTKALSDSPVMLDSLQTTLIFLRSYADKPSVIDRPFLAFSGAPVVESTSVDDYDRSSIVKRLSDLFALNDGTGIEDGLNFFACKGISNLTFANDFESAAFGKTVKEQIATPDAGLVTTETYSDPTYFDSDYAGRRTTF